VPFKFYCDHPNIDTTRGEDSKMNQEINKLNERKIKHRSLIFWTPSGKK
jgi:hypothetical protein